MVEPNNLFKLQFLIIFDKFCLNSWSSNLRIAKLRGKLSSCGWKIITSPPHVIQSLGNKAGVAEDPLDEDGNGSDIGKKKQKKR